MAKKPAEQPDPQVEDVEVQAGALLVEPPQAGAGQEEVAASVARHHARHRGVVLAEAHDHVLEDGHALALPIPDRAAEHL